MIDFVTFKSVPEFYNKELTGVKPNTVRDVDTDPRFDLLREWAKTRDFGFIQIINTETGKNFLREVTDVSFFKDQVIVSWRSKLSPQESSSQVARG